MTVIERVVDPHALPVLSLRVGLALSDALVPYVDGALRLKWPNDVFLDGGKLAGILVETRWRGAIPDWIAIGIGINLRLPASITGAATLRTDVSRDAVLSRVVPRVRDAVARPGLLTTDEVAAWDAHDLSRGRLVHEPASGRADGIAADGSLRVKDSAGVVGLYRSGSLRFVEDS